MRQNINEGADVIKLYVTGEGLLRPGTPPEETMYSFEEIAVAVDEAHKRNRQVAAHVRGNDGVKLCVEAGVDVLEHATYADDEAIAMIAERKDDIFVVPGLGYHWGILENGPACGITPEHLAATEYQEEWDLGCMAMDKLRQAGVRVVPGGDYGFVWCPHGQYAKDIELFVTDMGFSPMEAIVAATKHGCRAAPAGARVRHDRGRQVRRHPRRRRRPARGHRDPAGSLEARHGDGERQGHGEHARARRRSSRTSRTT